MLTTGTQTVDIPGQVGTIANMQKLRDIRQDMHFVKFGVNYHFNALPSVVSAKF